MNKKFIRVLAGLGLAHLAFAPFVAAQECINQLGEVVVTASRSPRKQSETGKVVRVISSQQLAQSQGRSLPELLHNFAGITIGGNATQPGDIKSLYLRGASAGNTLILIDGIAVNDAASPSGEYDISSIAIDQIERIEILKGGNSTLYGSDAVAGVINIITKKGNGNLNAGVLATGGSYGTFKQAFSFNGEVGDTRIALNASNLNTQGFSVAKSANSSGNFDKDGFDQQGMSLNLSHALSDRFKLNANLQANVNKSDLDDGAFADNPDYVSTRKSSLMGLGGKYIAGNTVIDFNLNHNKVLYDFESYGDRTRNEGKITNIEANFTTPLLPFADFISGLSYKRSATDQKSPYGDLQADNNIASGFGSLFFKFSERFRTELGGRYNYHNVYGSNSTYTFNPSYLIAGRYKLFVNLSSAFKVPSLYQLFSEYGNANLKPERTRTLEAGADMDVLPGKWRINLAYFNRDIKDVIDFGLVGMNYSYVNQNRQKDHGFELESDFLISPKMRFEAFYAYVNGKQLKGSQEERNLYLRPKHSAGFNFNHRFNQKWSASMIYKWVGERSEEYYDVNLNQLATAKLKDYHLLDAYLQFQAKRNLSFFADVKNLLDRDYVDRSGYTTKGISFNAGFKYDIR
jgi:vitamin B12 transporter